MNLPPSEKMTPVVRQIIEQADSQNHKRNQDVEIGEGRLILTDTVTGTRYSVRVTSGTLGITAL